MPLVGVEIQESSFCPFCKKPKSTEQWWKGKDARYLEEDTIEASSKSL